MKFQLLNNKLSALPLLIALACITQTNLRADTDLGNATSIVNTNGSNKPLNGDGGYPHLWRAGDGKLYIKYNDGATVGVPKGATVKVSDGTSYVAEATLPGPDQIFVTDLTAFVNNEVAGLTATTPVLGETFFALSLSASLDAEGDAAQLFGSTSALVTGVVGFDQSPGALSLLGSLTADGMTPVRFDYNTSTTPLTVAFDANDVRFVSGSVFTPTPLTTFEVIGQTPEPSTVSLFGIGLSLLFAGAFRAGKRAGSE